MIDINIVNQLIDQNERKQILDIIHNVELENKELRNKIILVSAERDGAVSMLLDVQQDCIAKNRIILDLKEQLK